VHVRFHHVAPLQHVHRDSAAAALGILGAKEAIPDLINCLKDEEERVRDSAETALRDFSSTGTILVGTILVTGIVNVGSVVGWGHVAALPQIAYGRLLIAKVGLFLLMLGLAFYGIKMTHRVAGPLFKVSLYLAKMKDGRYDKVWNLRKGDQLVEFYEHFKHAHAGVVALERSDIEQMTALIAAAKQAGAGETEAVKELEALVARKEKALE